MKTIFTTLFIAAFFMAAVPAAAGELIFNFISPSLGGSPMNGQWLMNYMSAQNDFAAKPGEQMKDLGEALKQVKEATINIQAGTNQNQTSVNVQ